MTGWTRTVAADLRRHWRHFAASGVGIVLGVAALTFLLALGLQVRQLLLVQVFPGDLIEVTPKTSDVDLFALRFELGSDVLDPEALEELESIDGVVAVYPKMRLTVPAMATGGASLFGAGMQTELVADGIDPGLVRPAIGEAFREVDGAVPDSLCTTDAQCGDDAY